jgi:uncharacterized protein with HEPN domain
MLKDSFRATPRKLRPTAIIAAADIAGMRDVLIHQYQAASTHLLSTTATREVVVVIERRSAIIAELDRNA